MVRREGGLEVFLPEDVGGGVDQAEEDVLEEGEEVDCDWFLR